AGAGSAGIGGLWQPGASTAQMTTARGVRRVRVSRERARRARPERIILECRILPHSAEWKPREVDAPGRRPCRETPSWRASLLRGGRKCEGGDGVEQARMLEDVVVMGSQKAEEAFGLAGGGKQRLAERIGHHLVLVAMRDEERNVYAADAAQRIEATAREQPGQAIVEARHVPHRSEG